MRLISAGSLVRAQSGPRKIMMEDYRHPFTSQLTEYGSWAPFVLVVGTGLVIFGHSGNAGFTFLKKWWQRLLLSLGIALLFFALLYGAGLVYETYVLNLPK